MTTRSVLIAEDEVLVAMELRDHLQTLGFQRIAVVASAEDAIRHAEQSPPDIALLDIRLRGGDDGIAVGSELSGRFDVPVIFVTAHSDSSTLSQAKRVAPYGYLLKPIDAASLRTTVETALVRHARHRASLRAATSAEARERQIQGLAGRLEFLLSASPVITYTADFSSTFATRYISPNVERILGWAPEEIVADHSFFGHNIHPDDYPHVKASLEGLRTDFPVTVEYQFRRQSGEFRNFVDYVNLVGDEREHAEVIGFMLDVTEQRAAEAQLRESERLAAVGSMVSGLAHEVRNPLFAISATLDAFADRVATISGLEPFFAGLEGGVRRLRDLMGQLLILGDPAGLDPRSIALRKIIDQAIIRGRSQASHKNINVVQSIEPDLEVRADPDRVIHAFRRIIDNAVEHSPAGSRIVITAAARGSVVECVIRDSGSGFEPSDIASVFEPFFTRRPGATGLGLSIARRIIEDLGGSISVGPGPSGCVLITMPLAVRPSSIQS